MFRFLLFAFIANEIHSARILGVVPTTAYSHQVAFWKLWEELSLRGHQVTVITSDPINKKSLTNLTEINLHENYKIFQELDLDRKIQELENNFIGFVKEFISYQKVISERTLLHPSVQNLLNEKFDIVLVETFFSDFFAFGELFNCPIIAITSMDAGFEMQRAMGNVYHPILHPNLLLPLHGPLSLKQRFISTFYIIFGEYVLRFLAYPAKNDIIKTFFPTNKMTIQELTANIDMLFVNANDAFNDVKPHVPNTVLIGGGNHIFAPKPLSQDLQEFLDSAKEGAIYFSLGSNVKSRNLDGGKLNAIMDSLKSLPYKVLWKFENDELENKPANVKIIKWAPQQDILRHPNIKLFVTQGGLQSVEEAIHFHVPMVVMPFFGDQGQNAKRIAHKEIGVEIEHKNLKKDELLKAIHEVIDNPIYRENIVKLSKLMLDQPMSGIEKAVWWTEYVIRNKGAKHFKYPAWDIPFYQYYLLDVIGITVAVLLLVGISVFYATRTIYKRLKSKFVKRNKVKQK